MSDSSQGVPIDTDPNAKIHKVPISGFSSTNQEQDRIAREIEAIFQELPEEVQSHWVTSKAIMHSLCTDLGYEDEDELEDALGMEFLAFCEALDSIEVGESEGATGKVVPALRIKQEEKKCAWKRATLTIEVKERDDLWQVLYLSPYAHIKIPEIDFEVVADGNKKVHNPLYNHFSSALQNLELFCIGQTPEAKARISTQMDQVQKCLDLERTFTVVVDDPSGLSKFENPDRATRVEYEEEKQEEVDEDLADFPNISVN